jgi:hypothetical protein
MIPRRIVLALLSLNFATPAGASYLYWRNGSVTYLPDELMLFAVALAAAALLWLVLNENASSSSIGQMSLDLPDEVREPESVEYYDDMTDRTRALKRKLDADTDLAQSYISAARARAELDEIAEIEDAGHGRMNRRINSRR